VNREFLPSVSALLALHSAGRHGSVTVAASELNLTQSAVSRQIRQLENFLGTSLFHRSHQRVSLTDAGRLYLKDVTAILEHLDAATRRATMGNRNSMTLSLPVLPTLATRWLVPRLPDFLSNNSGVTLNLSERRLPFGSEVEALDCAVTCGGPIWPETVAYPLMDEFLIAACSPKFLKQHRIQSAADFTTLTLLHETGHQSAWSDWLRGAGVKDYCEPRGLCFEQDVMLSQAAVAGLGVALLPKLLVGDELACGSLVQPLQDAVLRGRSYSLVVPSSKIGSPLIQRFREWIVQQAETLRLTSKVAVGTDVASAVLAKVTENRGLQAPRLIHRPSPFPTAQTAGKSTVASPLR
jgi:LysR family glycine cleavage system transcriptional activator